VCCSSLQQLLPAGALGDYFQHPSLTSLILMKWSLRLMALTLTTNCISRRFRQHTQHHIIPTLRPAGHSLQFQPEHTTSSTFLASLIQPPPPSLHFVACPACINTHMKRNSACHPYFAIHLPTPSNDPSTSPTSIASWSVLNKESTNLPLTTQEVTPPNLSQLQCHPPTRAPPSLHPPCFPTS
jgi:hypothetical protein